MKINGTDIPDAGFGFDDARTGYKNVVIKCAEFDLACRKFFASRDIEYKPNYGKKNPKTKKIEKDGQ